MSPHGPPGRERGPLCGVTLCCTAITPERRSELYTIAKELGASTQLDLTSDVTHLIVGSVNTPKYHFVAKERQDIKVLRESWVSAVRDAWITAEDDIFNIHILERQHQLPTFFGLKICVTGFDDFAERNDLMHYFTDNGAEYNGDLTRHHTTHLVAAKPAGSKYVYAGKWNIKIVTQEWVHASLARGMILDEALYHPAMPPDQRGLGAISTRAPPSPITGKRQRQEDRQAEALDATRRKLRRTASLRLGSQKEDVWAQLGPLRNSDPDPEPRNAPDGVENSTTDDVTQPGNAVIPRQLNPAPNVSPDYFFANRNFYIHGFDEQKSEILQRHIVPHGGSIASSLQSPATRAGAVIVVPHGANADLQSGLMEDEPLSSDDIWVTEHWLEKCLHSKSFVARDSHPLYDPFIPTSIPGSASLTICPTSFTGVDLLHFSKAAKLSGAKYDEALRPTTSVLVSNKDAPVKPEKLRFALENRIPIVSQEWLFESMRSQEWLPFSHYALSGSRQSQVSTQPTFYHPVDNPRPRPAEPRPTRPTRPTNESFRSSKSQRQGQLDLSYDQQPQLPRKGPFVDEEEDEPSANASQTSNRALQDLPPTETNSPRKGRSCSPIKRPLEETEEDPAPTILIQGQDPSPVATLSTEPAPSITNPPFSFDEAAATLRAHKAKSSHHASASASMDGRSTSERRYRPLGRAQSNGSAGVLSRKRSESDNRGGTTFPGSDGAGKEDSSHDDARHAFAPSQAVQYEDPEGAAIREQLMRRGKGELGGCEDGDLNSSSHGLQGVWDDDGSMKRVQEIGRVTDSGAKALEEKGRRRGMRRR